MLQGNQSVRWQRLLGFWVAAVAALTLTACGGGNQSESRPEASVSEARARIASAASVQALSALSVKSVVVKAERRVGRTLFEYDFQVTFQNQGQALSGVTATLIGVGAGTTVVDGNVSVGTIGAGATVVASDTITLRQDRTVPFQPSALTWQFSADPPPVVSLPGNPADQAVENVPEYAAAVSFPSQEIDLDIASGVTVIRSKWIFGFKEGTSVSQVNALLQSLGATVVRSYAQTGMLEVRVPDPGSLAALDQALANLRANPIVTFAIPAMVMPTNALPTALQTQSSDIDHLAHHLAIRGAAAWNARRAQPLVASTARLSLAIVDRFGDGAPVGSLLGAQYSTVLGTGFLNDPQPEAHGYHVLGIAAASFNAANDQSDGNVMSGIYASQLPIALSIEDLVRSSRACVTPLLVGPGNPCRGVSVEERMRDLIRANAANGGHMVMNTSLGGNNGTLSLSAPVVAGLRLRWLMLLRGGFGAVPSPAEATYFHAASAGNNPAASATLNQGWTLAALDGSLNNTAVVENRAAAKAWPFAAADLHSSSSSGGNLSAIGSSASASDDEIWSYGDAAGTPVEMLGTSMAAPQVAGLAANLWAIRPDFTSSQVLDTLRSQATAQVGIGQPLVDAYATLLAADEPDAMSGVMGNPRRAPVRLAILDIDEDGAFTYDDAVLFVDAFTRINGDPAYDVSPGKLKSVTTQSGVTKMLDPSRFDLNGDGKVGGGGISRFNLDIDYGPQRKAVYALVKYEVLPSQKVQLDESAVTDFQVLCYYVYSPLWRDKAGKTRANFETYLKALKTPLSCGGAIAGVEIKVNDVFATWSGLPATITMSGLYAPISRTDFQIRGNSSTCGNQGLADGERGSPLFSIQADIDAVFQGARTVTGMPSPNSGGGVNRNNCSSYFAYKVVIDPATGQPAGKYWANATGRAVSGFGTGFVKDWEYQVRYYSGDPAVNYADKKVLVGLVPNSGFFQTSFEAKSTSLTWVLAAPTQ